MTRSVECVQQPARDSNRTRALRDQDCQNLKPGPVQACNRFDCPPMWDPQDWGQVKALPPCLSRWQNSSRTSDLCGPAVLQQLRPWGPDPPGPVQTADGGRQQPGAARHLLPLPRPPHPAGLQPAGVSPDLGHGRLVPGRFCGPTSGSSGRGASLTLTLLSLSVPSPAASVFRGYRRAVRNRGQRSTPRTASGSRCPPGPDPAPSGSVNVRHPSCIRLIQGVVLMLPLWITDVVKSDRTILAQKKVYVQWRKAKKLHLVIGGHAYLLPWTTLLLRCPTRHFRKGHVQWLKDGKPLANVPHVSITALGHVRVQQVRPSDVGVYTCVAGSAHEHFVLQVLGSTKKPAAPEPRQSDGTFSREFCSSLNRYDGVVEQLLELRRSLQEDREDAATPGVKNNPEDGGSEQPGLFLLIADTYRLDQLLSDGGLGGPRAQQLVAHLFHQPTATQGDANESTLHPPDGAESSTLAPFLHKPRIKAQTSKSPVIIQRPPKFQQPSADMVVAVGAPVLLQRPLSSLELSCEVLGSPEPSVTWTRNGKKLQQNSR